jgi:hypothetical protein
MIVYVAVEMDVWQSYDSKLFLGIFSTYEKAYEALSNYGELVTNQDGTITPTNNENDVVLRIFPVTVDEFGAF